MSLALVCNNFHNYPTIFQPISLRSGNRFRSLSKHYFTKLEKEWSCLMSIGCSKKCSDFCDRYDIPMSIIKEWIEIFEQNEAFVDGYCVSMYAGCPVDAVSMSIIQNFVTEHYPIIGELLTNTNDINQEFQELVNDQILKSWERSRF